MEISLSTTQSQVAGLVNKFQVENLRDLILVSMMKQSSAKRRDLSLQKVKNMFLKRPQFMVTRVHTTLSQLDGQVNKSQVESLKDLTLVLMTKLSSAKKELSSTKVKNMFQKKPLSTAIKVRIIQFQLVGLENRFQVENLRDQIQVSMMKLY